MPKSKKSDTDSSEYESDTDSGPDDRNPPPPAKKSKGEPAKAADKKSKSEATKAAAPSSESVSANGPWILEGLRQVSISEFRGRKSVDIREFYEKNGEKLPGRKGISLSISQWLKLVEVADEVTAAVRNQ